MKLFLIFAISLFSFSALAGSLKCKLTKNASIEYAVIETTESVDVEENSEYYLGIVPSEVKVEITYLPHQEGIYLHLKDLVSGALASSINHKSVSLGYTVNNNTYRIGCFVN